MVTRLLTAAFIAITAILYFCPLGNGWGDNALGEGVRTAQVYVQLHLLTALLPALALAAVISVSIDKAAVVRHLSSSANRAAAYGVASASGGVLSVCSCSVLPLFAGICRMGAGLGPAIAFLYAGPAINILAIVLTARILGWQTGLARGIGAVGFGILIGGVMSLIFGRGETPERRAGTTGCRAGVPGLPDDPPAPPLRRVAALVAALLGIVIFLTWSPSGFAGVLRCCPDGKTSSAIAGQLLSADERTVTYRDNNGDVHTQDRNIVQAAVDSPLNQRIYAQRFALAGLMGLLLLIVIALWFGRQDVKQWTGEAWLLARQVAPLFLAGVFISGMLLGRPGHPGLIPSTFVASAVGGNGLLANAAAAALGTVMYFATLNEVPLVQGLINGGMGHGPALAMLLAGPAVPGLLVLSSLMGWRRTAVYTALVIVTATTAGTLFGAFFP